MPRRECSHNALVYLAQKNHSSYAGKDSYGYLLKSITLLKKNYFSVNAKHLENVDLFLFHTNDFTVEDLEVLEETLGSQGVLRLVNLEGSSYWQRPAHHKNDNVKKWAVPMYSEGYRRMVHWFAIDIWHFFRDLNEQEGCAYKYIARLDEDSFIHSPIRYDLFDYMQSSQFVYGYRMCSYEMQPGKRLWTKYKEQHPEFQPQREIDTDNLCGFYNNFFVADLDFFQRPPVQHFLRFVDLEGDIYRRRVGDLVIHTMAVLAFAQCHEIHRFLDFSYEHSTILDDGCLFWGGLQTGYNDENALATVRQFRQRFRNNGGCGETFLTRMTRDDLSPSYAHLPPEFEDGHGNASRPLILRTVVTDRLEQRGRGIMSG